ncbi:MAG: DUF4900 domain-containing protein [Candidatus Eisenbacteria bacterium]|nr:DUF4900 domain-containing protein [Candidatus Eisenbacteria bacterium]
MIRSCGFTPVVRRGVGRRARVGESMRLRSDRGMALVGVMAIVFAVLLVGVAIFILGHAEGDVVEYGVDDTRAFYLAEAGLERARAYLTALEISDPTANPVGTTFSGQMLGGGLYDVEIVSDALPGSWLDGYDVVSTGAKDGVLRQVKATLLAETFAIYQSFTGSGGAGYSWFRTGERFEGPVHLNGNLDVDGDPWFGGLVRAHGHDNIQAGSNPTFVRGYELGVDQIDLPTRSYVRSTLRAAAISLGNLWPSIGNKSYYEVELGYSAPGDMRVQGYDRNGNPVGLGWVGDVSTLGGAVWFEEDVRIKGVLDGQLTIGADGNIEIWDDVVYEGSTPGGGGLDPDCDDVLGLVAAGASKGNIIIKDLPANHDGVEIHAVMMALQSRLEVENYNHLTFLDYIHLYGGIVQFSHEQIAQPPNGIITSGYMRDYHYDFRALTLPPPFFPFGNNFAVLTWEEIVPVVVS